MSTGKYSDPRWVEWALTVAFDAQWEFDGDIETEDFDAMDEDC